MERPDVPRLRAAFSGPHDLLRTADGKTLFLRRWEPDGEPVASLLVFHGITGYSEPYGPLLAEELARAGFRVHGLDLRGHGLSDGRRGDYPGAARLAEDVAEAVRFVRARSKKLVLLGHSLGAAVALLAVQERPAEVDGLILLSVARRMRPGVYAKPSAGAAFGALLAVSLFRGWPMIPYRRPGMTGLHDPLFNFRYSARFYTAIYGVPALRLARMLRVGLLDSPRLRLERPLRVPLLVALGDRDELFPVECAQEFLDELPADEKQLLVLPGARHAAFPKGSWAPVAEWLRTKL
jgi:acylglycerol lipase